MHNNFITPHVIFCCRTKLFVKKLLLLLLYNMQNLHLKDIWFITTILQLRTRFFKYYWQISEEILIVYFFSIVLKKSSDTRRVLIGAKLLLVWRHFWIRNIQLWQSKSQSFTHFLTIISKPEWCNDKSLQMRCAWCYKIPLGRKYFSSKHSWSIQLNSSLSWQLSSWKWSKDLRTFESIEMGYFDHPPYSPVLAQRGFNNKNKCINLIVFYYFSIMRNVNYI